MTEDKNLDRHLEFRNPLEFREYHDVVDLRATSRTSPYVVPKVAHVPADSLLCIILAQWKPTTCRVTLKGLPHAERPWRSLEGFLSSKGHRKLEERTAFLSSTTVGEVFGIEARKPEVGKVRSEGARPGPRVRFAMEPRKAGGSMDAQAALANLPGEGGRNLVVNEARPMPSSGGLVAAIDASCLLSELLSQVAPQTLRLTDPEGRELASFAWGSLQDAVFLLCHDGESDRADLLESVTIGELLGVVTKDAEPGQASPAPKPTDERGPQAAPEVADRLVLSIAHSLGETAALSVNAEWWAHHTEDGGLRDQIRQYLLAEGDLAEHPEVRSAAIKAALKAWLTTHPDSREDADVPTESPGPSPSPADESDENDLSESAGPPSPDVIAEKAREVANARMQAVLDQLSASRVLAKTAYLPVVENLQPVLRAQEGRSFGSLDLNKKFALELTDTLKGLGLAIRCSTCHQPAFLRVSASGNRASGSFEYTHGGVRHGGLGEVPKLDLVVPGWKKRRL